MSNEAEFKEASFNFQAEAKCNICGAHFTLTFQEACLADAQKIAATKAPAQHFNSCTDKMKAINYDNYTVSGVRQTN